MVSLDGRSAHDSISRAAVLCKTAVASVQTHRERGSCLHRTPRTGAHDRKLQRHQPGGQWRKRRPHLTVHLRAKPVLAGEAGLLKRSAKAWARVRLTRPRRAFPPTRRRMPRPLGSFSRQRFATMRPTRWLQAPGQAWVWASSGAAQCRSWLSSSSRSTMCELLVGGTRRAYGSPTARQQASGESRQRKRARFLE